MYDPSELPEDARFDGIQSATMTLAMDALRHKLFFHTRDLAQHFTVQSAHPMASFNPSWQQTVEAWLTHHAFRLGVRGPLPGEATLGARWAFFTEEASPT